MNTYPPPDYPAYNPIYNPATGTYTYLQQPIYDPITGTYTYPPPVYPSGQVPAYVNPYYPPTQQF